MKKDLKITQNAKSINPSNSQKILITGGCGFIGVNLVNYLLTSKFNHVRILDDLSTGTKETLEDVLQENGEIESEIKKDKIIYKLKSISGRNIQKNMIIELTIGDIRSYETCLKATRDMNSVVHLAAHAGVIPSINDPFHDFDVNAQGTLNLLYASVKNSADKFILASSNATLGDQKPPMNEKKVPKPLSPYGASKLACEGYCSAFYSSYGLKTITFRFSNAYGPYSIHKNSVVSKFIKDAIIKKSLIIYGDGTQTRDFIYVNDICKAIVLSTESTSEIIYGETFHLSTGKETSIINLAKLIKNLFKEESQIEFKSSRKGEIKRNYSDVSKASKLFGYRPEWGLEKGVKKVHEWFLKQGIEKIKNVEILSGSNPSG